ncbi:MAG: YceI family protein [Pseudomonadota bacterium]|nr:YceI family protein [Pseudomonadota bacterium]
MKAYWLLVLALFALPVSAQDWKVDTAKSQIGFVIKQMNVPVEGGFGRYSVKATFDAARPELGFFRVDLDVASINTGSEEGDDEAKRPAWFDTARYPKASFVSKAIRRDAAGRFTVMGDFTLKGRTLPLIVPFILTPQRGGGWLASGRAALKRSQFDIGGGEWADPSVVADDLEARFKIMLNP